MEKEIKTGLGVKVTFFTDEECKEMLEVPEYEGKEGWEDKKDGMDDKKDGKDGRRRLQRKERGNKKDKEGEGEDKEGEKEGEGKEGEKDGEGMGKGKMGKGPQMRVRENPSMRVIPVVDGEGQTKCSFDARSDREMGRFRETVCTDDNVLGVTTYDDVLCSEKSDMPAAMPLIFRGKCMELPMREKKDMKEGGDRKGGRRLMEKYTGQGKMGEDKEDEDDDEEGFFGELCSEEKGNNSVTDLLKGLMCWEDEDEEDDMDEDDKKKGGEKDSGKDEMEMKKLYIMYDWQYLMKDGEKTEEEFCFKAEDETPDVIKTADDFQAYCDSLEKCGGICKSAKTKVSKEDKKKGIKPTTTCGPSKKVVKKNKVKCKKVADLCDMFEGCKKSEKKGKVKCSGSMTLE